MSEGLPDWRAAVEQLTAEGAEFEMTEELVLGRRVRTYVRGPRTLDEIVRSMPGHGDRIHYVYEGEHLTYTETHSRIVGLARWLREVGIVPGDRVALAMRNYPEWPVVFWAVVSVGAVAVPLNAWWTGRELAYAIGDCGPKLLFADAERMERLATVGSTGGMIRIGVRAPGAGDLDMEDLLPRSTPTEGELPELPEVDLHPDRDATIFYTSGTTGSPKGAVGTHRNMLSNLHAVRFRSAAAALMRGEDPADLPRRSMLLAVPLFHVTGCHSIMQPTAAAGGRLVAMYRWDPVRAVELIAREEVTAFTGVPTMVLELLDAQERLGIALPSLRYIGAGGAPAPPEMVRRITTQLGIEAGNGYGMTESSALAVATSGPLYRAAPDSVGHPPPVTDVRIVDEDGRTLGVGESGELWIRGPNVVRGYWNRPEATAEAITDGWLHSGDVAVMDADGTVRIVDRIKDVVIRGGENIYCVEVEDALYEHPGVREAVVFGLPHERLGDELAAVVVVRPGFDLDAEAVATHVGERLARFKVPTRIHLRSDALPRNASGKLLKRQVREEVLASGAGRSPRDRSAPEAGDSRGG